MDQDIFKHDHALSSWITLCISRDGVTMTVLMIETDLNLNAKDSNYRKDSIDSLVAAAVAYVGDHPHIDTIEIEQMRQGSLDVTSLWRLIVGEPQGLARLNTSSIPANVLLDLRCFH
jgi:hypothetical protein